MSEVKDPKIKLFGKTIELPETSLDAAAAAENVAEAAAGEDDSSIRDPPSSSDSMNEQINLNGDAQHHDQEPNKNQSDSKQDAKEEDCTRPLTSQVLKDSNTARSIVEEPKTSSVESDTLQSSKTEDDQIETSNSQDKTLKKPDKIIPCPRCNSMDTKFCYFNNYNVNQPRHFCKNCQRYWTAGGTMRNVPVGAGRRKNKNVTSQYGHLNISEGLQNARVDLPNGIHHPMLSPNGAVITFNSDTPLCESMVSVLNIADKTVRNTPMNGFHIPEQVGIPASHVVKENIDDHSSGSPTAAASSKEEEGENGLQQQIPNCHPFPPQMPCFPGAPWPYPWHSVPWSTHISPPNFPPPGSFAMPFYATPLPQWGCALPSPWNVPWVIPPTTSQNHTPPTSGPNSPTLGKHSREDNILKPVNRGEASEKESNPCLWVPKTLRIDDPGEAAKSSIWATLGIKNERSDSIGGGGLFKPFQSQSKDDIKAPAQETSTVLQANPAALSRSLSFHESS